MWVYLTAGEEYARPCDDCRAFWYRNGRREPRPKGILPRCRECPKLSPRMPPEKCNWEYAADLTPQMAEVWAHYKRCRAVNSFPKDRLVEECAARILSAQEKADRFWDGRNVREGMGSVVGDLIQLSRKVR